MIFSTSNQETEISAEKQEVYFKKSDVIDLIIDSEENDGTIDSRVLLEKLRKLPTIPQTDIEYRVNHFGETCKKVNELLPIEELPTIPQTDSVLYPPIFIDKDKIKNKIAETQTNTIKGLDGTVYVQDNDKQGFTPQTDSVLEDIKAEIEEFKNNEHTYEYGGFDRAYNGIMEIIERHISGKE